MYCLRGETTLTRALGDMTLDSQNIQSVFLELRESLKRRLAKVCMYFSKLVGQTGNHVGMPAITSG